MGKVVNKPKDKLKVKKIELTKEQLADVFKKAGVPVPEAVKVEKKVGKTDKKLTHIAVEHLFMGVLQQVRQAARELERIVEKKDDSRAKDALKDVLQIDALAQGIVNGLSETITDVPTVAELDEVLAKLAKELESAQLLSLMDTDVPKEKMN